MIAVDTNILVYAHRQDSSHHREAFAALERLAEGGGSWAIPWPCIHEFLAIVTHPRIYRPPSGMGTATDAVADLLSTAGVLPLAETRDHASLLTSLLIGGSVAGPKVHDARIAAICLGHGITELWTADRDFSYFPELRTLNPLVA